MSAKLSQKISWSKNFKTFKKKIIETVKTVFLEAKLFISQNAKIWKHGDQSNTGK